MRYAVTILILFIFNFNGHTQDMFHVDRIPSNTAPLGPGSGALLDKGWRWQKGDNILWSQPTFNDSAWQLINPLLDVHHSLPQIQAGTIVWLRLHFSVDSAIQKKQLALLIQQSGASEIYLNGQLIKQVGMLDADPGKIKAYDPIFDPILLPVNNGPVQVLAVRYALEKNVHYTTAFFSTTNPLLIAKLQYAQEAIDAHHHSSLLLNGYYFFIIGLFFLLALIHSGYYFFRKAQRANLFFALYAFCYIGFILCPILIDIHTVQTRYYSSTAALLLIIVVGPLLLTAIYELLDAKKDWVYKATLLLSAISIGIYFWQYEWGWHIGADVMTFTVQITIIRIVVKAVNKKKKGARLLAVGAFFFLLSFSLFVLFTYLLPENLLLIGLLYAVGVLSIPLATSVYLGLEFGFLNLSLKQKLEEVSELSQKNIAQEKEKQQILADQNETLEKQVVERTQELNHSIENLKSTQAQLVQSEKMASLGELTAGIAHEIQNPLNFVNNFSEVSNELIDEMNTELDKGDISEAKAIAADVKQNLEKINHHGKRADAIVKGMLQHSQKSSGQKEPTNINVLADEYLRLAYHGLRGKDNAFNVIMKTDFDQSIGNINIVPQDVGRVLLNLYNNAFYATNEKIKTATENYEPLVSVKTKRINDKIEIKISDNGNGIPQNIVDKIFQPFFTTKPTGQGTGLGLSLAYDIVKAHGGEIKVETKEGEGTIFNIQLPA